MKLRLIWRRWWVWVGALALLPAVGGVVWAAYNNVGEPYDPAIDSWLEGRFTQLYGPSRIEAFHVLADPMAMAQENPFMGTSGTHPVTDNAPIMDAPVARAHVAALREKAAPWFAAWDREAAQGGAWELQSPKEPQTAIPRNVNLLVVQLAVKARRAFALSDAGAGRMDAAIAEARKIAPVSDATRSTYIIGNLISVAGRALVSGAYTDLLEYPTTAAQAREIARDLRSLREDPIRMEPETVVAESTMMHRALSADGGRKMLAPLSLSGPVGAVLNASDILGGDRDYEVLRESFPDLAGSAAQSGTGAIGAEFLLPWTRPLLVDSKLRSIARNHPSFLAESLIPADAIAGQSPESRMFTGFAEGVIQSNYHEVITRNCQAQTRIALAQAAWAARAFHAENGRWPKSLDELDPKLWEPVAPFTSPSKDLSLKRKLENQKPFGPFRMGMISTESLGFYDIVGRAVRPAGLDENGKRTPSVPENVRMAFSTSKDSYPPSMPVAEIEKLAILASSITHRVPEERRSVRLSVHKAGVPARENVTPEELMVWIDWARAAPPPQSGPPPVGGYDDDDAFLAVSTFTQSPPDADFAVRLEIEIEFPPEVLAIWYPFDQSGRPIPEDTMPFPVWEPDFQKRKQGNVVFPGGLLRCME